MAQHEFSKNGGCLTTYDNNWHTICTIYLQEGECARLELNTIVQVSDGSKVGSCKRIVTLKRQIGGSIVVANNDPIHIYKGNSNWDLQITTDTSYCEIQIKGDTDETCDWHLDVDEVIVK